MSVHFMVHDQHGAHVAYSPEEVKKLEACGWRLKVEAPAVAVTSHDGTLTLPKRRGRPPNVKGM